MYVKVKTPGKVYYDFEQGINIDKRIVEVKATSLIRELIKSGDIVECDKPSDAVLKKYTAEDKAIEERQKAKVKTKVVSKTVETKLNVANKRISELEEELAASNEKLVAANLKIAKLEEVGDPKSTLAKKAAAVGTRKETTKASNGEKA